jgi:hypothetical protein
VVDRPTTIHQCHSFQHHEVLRDYSQGFGTSFGNSEVYIEISYLLQLMPQYSLSARQAEIKKMNVPWLRVHLQGNNMRVIEKASTKSADLLVYYTQT